MVARPSRSGTVWLPYQSATRPAASQTHRPGVPSRSTIHNSQSPAPNNPSAIIHQRSAGPGLTIRSGSSEASRLNGLHPSNRRRAPGRTVDPWALHCCHR